ncbi:uncharacterized protein LOC114522484 [Dendronephthya gigantea]|uniref:uncharacterized protein LOC114522484 n=1 Tax=Dendronephthya gigantea TaxID=151771 RepID=UPI00106ACA61|nr:uncharacterized protein LOC114522484 [Dendronephthya gigantea]
MAGALETDPINQLHENLQCTVCLEPLKDPKTLPCFHSFCKDCLEDVVKTCRDKAPRGRPARDIPCPYCREIFTLDPDKNVADMRRNHFICNIVKATAVLNRDRGTGVPCSHNCSQSYSVARCVTCEKFLCRECLTDHNKYRGNASHSVLTMEELSKPENRKKIKDKIYCNEHPGEILKVYCETCDQLICKDCMDFKHAKENHSCFLVNDVVSNYKKLLTLNNKAMDGVLNEGNAIVQQLTNTAEILDRDSKLTKTKIVNRKESIVNKVVEMLNKHTETLLKEVDQLHKEKREVLDGQTKKTKQYVENVQRSVQLSKKLVEEGTEEEIISSQKMMLKSADNLLKKRQEYFEHVTVEKLKYTLSTKDEPSDEEISRMLARCLGIKDGEPKLWNPQNEVDIHGNKLKVEPFVEYAASENVTSVSQTWSMEDDQPQATENSLASISMNFDKYATIKISGVSRFLKDQITKKFLSKKNSTGISGDVKRLYVCPGGRDYVLLEFRKEPKLRNPQNEVDIHGSKLKVDPFVEYAASENVTSVSQTWSMEDDQPHATENSLAPFSKARVKVTDEYLEKLEQCGIKETEVELDDEGYLIGPWNAIFRFGQSLRSSIFGFSQSDDLESRGSRGELDTASSVRQKRAADDDGDQPVAENGPQTILVQSLFYHYIMKYHYKEFQALENVCGEISIKIRNKTDKTLILHRSVNVSKADFTAALSDFVEFYQKQSFKMFQDIKSVRSKKEADVISEVSSKFPVIVDVTEESRTKYRVIIYGEKTNVYDMLAHLTTREVDQLNDVPARPSTSTTRKPGEQFVVFFRNTMKLIVYKGDLTEEKVDAIVNPANERLDHCDGAAEAISKAGGRSIQAQSDDIMIKRRGKDLVAGDVETTSAGFLPCKFIVHAVGPRRSQQNRESARKHLHEAVMNSLKTANKSKAKSISIPAISSGVFDIPVDLCAGVLFDAAEEFIKDRSFIKELQEIRFVNIDQDTTDVFVAEMKRRYTQNVKEEPRVESSSSTTQSRTTRNDAERQAAVTNPLKTPSRDRSERADAKANSSDEKCGICLCDFTDKKTLSKCGHSFCAACIDRAFQYSKKCPTCGLAYGTLVGNQPPGKMTDYSNSARLPGYDSCGTIVINYAFYGGVQGPEHPNPGQRYQGTQRRAYLPDNEEGRKVLRLLRKAFDQKLTFTIGRSSTSGADNVITWNDIDHKTNISGGATNSGYPDPNYLKRVQEELAAKGITE